MKFKKIMALIMSATLFASVLTGCGGSGDSSGDATRSESAEWEALFGKEYVKARAEYEAEHDPYDVPEELVGTTVTFATYLDPEGREDEWIFDNFEKDTGIKVDWVYVPQDTYYAQLSTMIAAGEAPDVYIENNEFFPLTFQISEPLDEIESIDINDPIWDTGYADFTTFGEHFYHLNAKYSAWQTTQVIFYNKKAMEENGIMTPQDYIDAGEWTVDNMIEIMREFSSLGEGYGGGRYSPAIFATSMDSSIMYLEDGRFVNGLGEDALVEAYKKYHQLYNEGIMEGASIENVIKGTVGIYAVDSYGLKSNGYFRAGDPSTLGFAPIPADEGKEYYTPAHYKGFGIIKGSKNAEAAGYFLRYYLDPYNYDWDTMFLSEDARDFYLEYVAGQDFSEKRFNFDLCGASIMGYSGQDGMRVWRQRLCWSSEAQLVTAMESIRNEVDTAVEKANAILDELAAQ